MYFVDPSFFTGDIHIPNMDENCLKDFTIFKLIAKWERECLELVLGKCLADELLSQFEITGEDGSKKYTLKTDSDPKWKLLIDGRKYSEDDESVSNFSDSPSCGCGCSECDHHFWEGLVYGTETLLKGEFVEFKESLIAYYIYYMWSFNNLSQTTGTGEQVPEDKNSSYTSNKLKRTSAFNYFWQKVRFCEHGGKVGLHQFLKEHSGLFPNFEEICFNNINIYDL
ncbi:hypothetical protein [Chryseobacterium sp. R2A-55]|uniref:hypothetical protein n=1 Tax=Chryseobacterium sp. R2A-55 TaxID=2744445 RepID=UPI001F452E2D|nr:hypothetical protein [Chryseobacterium sp. R2A-55]